MPILFTVMRLSQAFPSLPQKTVELSTFLKVINAIKAFFGLTVVKVILVIAFLAIVLYVYIFFKSLNKKKKVEKRRQSRRDSRLGPDDLEPHVVADFVSLKINFLNSYLKFIYRSLPAPPFPELEFYF